MALFANRRVDGMIVVPASDDQSHIARETASGTPVVFVDRAARGLVADSVVTTNESGAGEAVRHLASYGHRRIAYLGDRDTILTAQQRLSGYRDALSGAGLPLDQQLVAENLTDAGAADGTTTRMLTSADPPTALFTAQNLITIGAIRALRRLGLHRKVAVVGFDDFPLADLLEPAVTVVAQDVAAIGRLAAAAPVRADRRVTPLRTGPTSCRPTWCDEGPARSPRSRPRSRPPPRTRSAAPGDRPRRRSTARWRRPPG